MAIFGKIVLAFILFVIIVAIWTTTRENLFIALPWLKEFIIAGLPGILLGAYLVGRGH